MKKEKNRSKGCQYPECPDPVVVIFEQTFCLLCENDLWTWNGFVVPIHSDRDFPKRKGPYPCEECGRAATHLIRHASRKLCKTHKKPNWRIEKEQNRVVEIPCPAPKKLIIT